MGPTKKAMAATIINKVLRKCIAAPSGMLEAGGVGGGAYALLLDPPDFQTLQHACICVIDPELSRKPLLTM